MKLIGRDVSVDAVLAYIDERLAASGGAMTASPSAPPESGVEPRVDPLSFNLEKLGEHADPTRGLPLESHRDGLSGRLVVLAKQAFRAAGQLFINETLGRQRLFNGHVRDAYAQLSAELLRLRAQVAALELELKKTEALRGEPPASPRPVGPKKS
jgi:hypothetical protein